ncbi:hypothetical protein FALBO_11794 [Fusarium albosuccineum]|uniref:Uncharacterized protein n=1 Tax=Fusarium albosuccineum TaxID=1237068 RepID=A0A8H4L368_9HYPO|nr:hypothetical protein FALBO_11794 [Fusarium albosuccineum]
MALLNALFPYPFLGIVQGYYLRTLLLLSKVSSLRLKKAKIPCIRTLFIFGLLKRHDNPTLAMLEGLFEITLLYKPDDTSLRITLSSEWVDGAVTFDSSDIRMPAIKVKALLSTWGSPKDKKKKADKSKKVGDIEDGIQDEPELCLKMASQAIIAWASRFLQQVLRKQHQRRSRKQRQRSSRKGKRFSRNSGSSRSQPTPGRPATCPPTQSVIFASPSIVASIVASLWPLEEKGHLSRHPTESDGRDDRTEEPRSHSNTTQNTDEGYSSDFATDIDSEVATDIDSEDTYQEDCPEECSFGPVISYPDKLAKVMEENKGKPDEFDTMIEEEE